MQARQLQVVIIGMQLFSTSKFRHA